MRRRSFLAGALVVVVAGCSDDDGDRALPSTTTVPGPGAGAGDAVLLRTGAALSLAAAAVHQRDGGPFASVAAGVHRQHVPLLDDSVREPHADAVAAWTTPLDAELALAATFQAWVPALGDADLRQRVMAAGAAVARLHAALVGTSTGLPPLPEAFQLTDPAVPDGWLLR